MWGSPVLALKSPAIGGSIPTGVGQPPHRAVAGVLGAVYPHGCGAASAERKYTLRSGGLSPRVWGSPLPLSSEQRRHGSIPTGVGQPLLS